MKNYLAIPANFLNKFLVKAHGPRTFREILMAFGIPAVMIFGSEVAQNPKIFSIDFLLFVAGLGLNACALVLKKRRS